MNHGEPVVGQDHPVALQRRAARCGPGAGSPRCRSSRAAARAAPIGGRSGSSVARGEVARRVHERAPRALGREAQRVVDRAAAHLLVAGQAGQDRQPGGVRRRPAARAQAVRAQAPDRARAGAPAPAAGLRVGGVQLVQPAAVPVHDDHVPVAVGVAPALDRRAPRDRVAAAVGLVRVVERHAHARAGGATRSCTGCRSAALVQPGAEVGMHGAVQADAAHEAPSRSRPAGRRRARSSGCRAGRPGSAAPRFTRLPGASATSASRQARATSATRVGLRSMR